MRLLAIDLRNICSEAYCQHLIAFFFGFPFTWISYSILLFLDHLCPQDSGPLFSQTLKKLIMFSIFAQFKIRFNLHSIPDSWKLTPKEFKPSATSSHCFWVHIPPGKQPISLCFLKCLVIKICKIWKTWKLNQKLRKNNTSLRLQKCSLLTAMILPFSLVVFFLYSGYITCLF